MSDYVLLKWGTLKGWKISKDRDRDLLQKYFDEPVSMSAAMQKDTETQTKALIDFLSQFEGEIQNDWSGEKYTPEKAIEYIENYGKQE